MPSISSPDPSSTSVTGTSFATRLLHAIVPPTPPQPFNPALLKHAEQSAADVQTRVADRITAFAGSMTFVYLHVIWFAAWIGFSVEHYPSGRR